MYKLLFSHFILKRCILKKYILIVALASFLIGCKDAPQATEEKAETTPTELVANYKSIEVVIEGMSCEIGCAKLIESKLAKMEGVQYSKVDFESKTGQFTFDTNILSNEAISEKIAGIAGGDLYSVSKTTEIEAPAK